MTTNDDRHATNAGSATYNDVRFACRCGRFVAQEAVRDEDYPDPNGYYGIGTHVEWDCSRCGTVQGDGTWEPQLVIVATREMADGGAALTRKGRGRVIARLWQDGLGPPGASTPAGPDQHLASGRGCASRA